jgi:hypothetical protein
VSKQKLSKSKKRGAPIILPQDFAAASSGQGTPLLSGQQAKHIQELIDLLRKNNLTELELEREGLRIRVRYEIGVRTITTTVPEQGAAVSASTSQATSAAGTQTEDIEVTFDPTLPLPSPLPPSSIDNPFFSYRSTFKVEGRTLKIHREFVSRVPKQLCSPETEAQITADLVRVRTDVNSAYRFPAAVAPAPYP